MADMTPAEYGRWLAEQELPISEAQAEAAARILASEPTRLSDRAQRTAPGSR